MTNILHVSASVNGANSNSRQIATKLIDRITAADPSAKVAERDTNDTLITALTGETVGAYYTPKQTGRTPRRKSFPFPTKWLLNFRTRTSL